MNKYVYLYTFYNISKVMKTPIKETAEEANKQRSQEYRSSLKIDGHQLPDPFSSLEEGWVGEATGT